MQYEESTNQNEIVIDPPIALASFGVYRDSNYSTYEDDQCLKGMNHVLPSLVISIYCHHLCIRIDSQESSRATAMETIYNAGTVRLFRLQLNAPAALSAASQPQRISRLVSANCRLTTAVERTISEVKQRVLPLLNDQPWAEGSQPDGGPAYENGGMRVE